MNLEDLTNSEIVVIDSAAPDAYDALLAVMQDIDDCVAAGHEIVRAVEILDARTGASLRVVLDEP